MPAVEPVDRCTSLVVIGSPAWIDVVATQPPPVNDDADTIPARSAELAGSRCKVTEDPSTGAPAGIVLDATGTITTFERS